MLYEVITLARVSFGSESHRYQSGFACATAVRFDPTHATTPIGQGLPEHLERARFTPTLPWARSRAEAGPTVGHNLACGAGDALPGTSYNFV